MFNTPLILKLRRSIIFVGRLELLEKSPRLSETVGNEFITRERIEYLIGYVENIVRDHKLFSLQGSYPAVRAALCERGWLEKHTPTEPPPAGGIVRPQVDEIFRLLPTKDVHMSREAYVECCEKLIIDLLLRYRRPDFFWNFRLNDDTELMANIPLSATINRISKSRFACKAGLCALMSEMHWFCEQGVSFIRVPRCYNTTVAEQRSAFIDDFRLTACMSLLKYFLHVIETNGPYSLTGPAGILQPSVVQFAIDRCNEYVEFVNHADIDKMGVTLGPAAWDLFLKNFDLFVYKKNKFVDYKLATVHDMKNEVQNTLGRISNHWQQYDLDGCLNIWILKPWNRCMGHGIVIINNLRELLPKISPIKNKKRYIIQKYIEIPMLIHETKFDIRQWFLVTSIQPLTIWMYKECYLRFSSQKFDLVNFDDSIHLTNHAVQHKCQNCTSRHPELPESNMWNFQTFKAYLESIGELNQWQNVTYPCMTQAIVGAMLSSQDYMSPRPNAFQLYGADFMLGCDFTPWLLEINANPHMGSTTEVTKSMCPQCLEDIIKVILDRRHSAIAETGLFELIYKQGHDRGFPKMEPTLTVEGKQIKKPVKSDVPVPAALVQQPITSVMGFYNHCPDEDLLYVKDPKRVVYMHRARAATKILTGIPVPSLSTSRLVYKYLRHVRRSTDSAHHILEGSASRVLPAKQRQKVKRTPKLQPFRANSRPKKAHMVNPVVTTLYMHTYQLDESNSDIQVFPQKKKKNLPPVNCIKTEPLPIPEPTIFCPIE